MSEDIFLRNGKSRKPSIISEDESSPPSVNSSCHSIETPCSDNQDGHTQGISRQIMRVFIADGLEPGQKVKVSYPDGSKVRVDIPPQTEWRFKSYNGKPRPFFLVSVNPNARIVVSSTPHPPIGFNGHTSSQKQDQHCSTNSRKKVRFIDSSEMICQCAPSLGVYDSICPNHGTGSYHS
eukprot:CAMPEP_0201926058 /NCGR_PEP_ID=MMETSP0903-20130614/15105_1 /ASSEMBLY_ACC=CAM_ASM_000552 /TAXON_ID=420261 /ORGANISM="Thalassiosira antarctica, Strain CCMP982" /LENGTH=178 /DNA_ID=CAMNT_0048463791 /DNA_START=139 /DNA_END=675 /DNA_ORIENTATION=-